MVDLRNSVVEVTCMPPLLIRSVSSVKSVVRKRLWESRDSSCALFLTTDDADKHR